MGPLEDDDDWEYEYDDCETEDFFLPLDLANVPGAQVPIVSQGRPGHPTLLKSRLRALNAAQGQPADFSTDAANGQEENATMGQVQVTGLHTDNPLVMYNGQLLSCHWTSTIGTDMFFVKPDSGVGVPLRSLPSVDLVSLGSAKLMAKAAHLRPRDELFVDESDGRQSTGEDMSALNNDNTSDAMVPPIPPPEVLATDQIVQPVPTSFLAKLNLAKAKRGEKTRLATSSTAEGTRLVSEPARETTAAVNSASSQPLGDATMDGA